MIDIKTRIDLLHILSEPNYRLFATFPLFLIWQEMVGVRMRQMRSTLNDALTNRSNGGVGGDLLAYSIEIYDWLLRSISQEEEADG